MLVKVSLLYRQSRKSLSTLRNRVFLAAFATSLEVLFLLWLGWRGEELLMAVMAAPPVPQVIPSHYPRLFNRAASLHHSSSVVA